MGLDNDGLSFFYLFPEDFSICLLPFKGMRYKTPLMHTQLVNLFKISGNNMIEWD